MSLGGGKDAGGKGKIEYMKDRIEIVRSAKEKHMTREIIRPRRCELNFGLK